MGKRFWSGAAVTCGWASFRDRYPQSRRSSNFFQFTGSGSEYGWMEFWSARHHTSLRAWIREGVRREFAVCLPTQGLVRGFLNVEASHCYLSLPFPPKFPVLKFHRVLETRVHHFPLRDADFRFKEYMAAWEQRSRAFAPPLHQVPKTFRNFAAVLCGGWIPLSATARRKWSATCWPGFLHGLEKTCGDEGLAGCNNS